MNGPPDENDTSAHWAEAYYQDQAQARKTQGWKSLCRPTAIAAYIAISGRVIAGPLAVILLFISTNYLSDATVFIKADQSIFAFTERDPSMAGGCTGCLGPCKIAMLKYKLIENVAITSAPPFFTFTAIPPTESLYDFSSLSTEVLAFSEALDKNGTLCQSSKNEWGTSPIVVTGTAQELLNIINVAKLNLSPQMMRELELAIEHAEDCVTGWTMMSVVRLFQYPTAPGSTDFGQVPAVDTHVFPDYTECRPVVEITDELVGSKLALDTNGRDLLEVVPDQLKLFPYSFTSSLPYVSRSAPADPSMTKNGATRVVQSYFRAYYGGCRVRAVNTTGVYIEDSCEISKHWLTYGLMVHSPDDIPLCSTGDVCIHNYFNSLWEWEHYIDPTVDNRVGMNLNTFRSRYADRVSISILPGLVVTQLLAIGIVSLYQVMSHKQSVLLTEIWAYRCQNGVMQVLYLAQVTYHLVYNSDLYLLGLATGTLTTESIANLTCSFYAFSYSFINLVKARSGDQRLDRRFRLTWEAMQVAITLSVGLLLNSIQRTPIGSILSQNAEILRKTSARGAKYCGLNDACVLFTINMPTVVTVLSIAVGLVAAIISYTNRKMAVHVKRRVSESFLLSSWSSRHQSLLVWPRRNTTNAAAIESAKYSLLDNVTSFERNCLGAPFNKLFRDCDDIAYVVYNGKRCITVEALLLTGYLYYGEHIYRSSSVMLLLMTRVIPKKIIRTFNVLLLRWRLDPKHGTLTPAHSCTWFHASEEDHKLHGAMPVA